MSKIGENERIRGLVSVKDTGIKAEIIREELEKSGIHEHAYEIWELRNGVKVVTYNKDVLEKMKIVLGYPRLHFGIVDKTYWYWEM